MLVAGTLAALALFALAVGYCCAGAAQTIALRFGNGTLAGIGLAAFALFNPWVYNEVVAGHLIMVLAYGASIGLLGEMLRGRSASPLRLALWLVLAQAQLQFFIVAFVAALIFAIVTQKWLPVIAGVVVALPTVIGIAAERGALMQTPYALEWQANQSLYPLPLLTLGGYFAGYADRLGVAAQAAVAIFFALALCGIVFARKRRSVGVAAIAAVVVYLIALGVHGPLGALYASLVQDVPETGVFRELYDLAGVLAALILIPAAAAAARYRALQWAALAAGVALPVIWLVHPPSDWWIGAQSYPHPAVTGSPYARVALLPAFQPMRLSDGRGSGADPDLHLYPDNVAPINEYLASYPVDAALARYVQSGDVRELQSLGVQTIISRPWLVSLSNGSIGLAAVSLPSFGARPAGAAARAIAGAVPLLGACDGVRVVASPDELRSCDLFLGDAPQAAALWPLRAPNASIDPRSAWIDAQLAFARDPSLAQGIGGVLTQSRAPLPVDSNAWLLAYVRGALRDARGRALAREDGAFTWVWLPATTRNVLCDGLCELVAQTRGFPAVPLRQRVAYERALRFDAFAPWLLRVRGVSGTLLRLNARYDREWLAFSGTHLLPHVRISLAANAWFLPAGTGDVVLLQLTALLQLVAELAGLVYTAFLLKALFRRGTKRT
jgi:hypothetical protein